MSEDLSCAVGTFPCENESNDTVVLSTISQTLCQFSMIKVILSLSGYTIYIRHTMNI